MQLLLYGLKMGDAPFQEIWYVGLSLFLWQVFSVIICQHMLESAKMRIVTVNRGNCYYLEYNKVECIVLTFV